MTLTSGLVRTEIAIGGAVFEVAGSNFLWRSAGDFHTEVARNCGPCPDGTKTTLSGGINVTNGGTLVWNGETYQDVPIYGRGSFTTNEVVVSGSGPFSLSTPFRFQGVFDVFLEGQSVPPTFAMMLTGSGTALAHFRQSPDLPGFHFPEREGLTYTFEAQQQSPVPEPASLVLIGTGLAGLVVRRWRSKPKH